MNQQSYPQHLWVTRFAQKIKGKDVLQKYIRPRVARSAGVCLCVLAAFPCAHPAPEDGGGDPAVYLEFESTPDGRCQILSAGGKLRVMRNTHAERAIAYRLVRIFVGVQQGLSAGTAPPGGEAIQLGCTKVDGRTQEWALERASFANAPNGAKLTR